MIYSTRMVLKQIIIPLSVSFLLETLLNQVVLGTYMEFYAISIFMVFIAAPTYICLPYIFLSSVTQDILQDNFIGSSGLAYFLSILVVTRIQLNTKIKRVVSFVIFIATFLLLQSIIGSLLYRHFAISVSYLSIIANSAIAVLFLSLLPPAIQQLE